MSIYNRPNGNQFIPSTGMDFGNVQTGFSIRTGFYLTNSGNNSIYTTIERSNEYPAFDFPSGVNSAIPIGRGQCKYVEFDFYSIFDTATGPKGSSGPAYSGMYNELLTLSSFSLKNDQTDTSGTILMHLTGGVSGHMTPHHPYRFLVKTGIYSGDGSPMTELRWQHPNLSSGNYFLTQYNIEISNRAPEDPDHSEWTGFHNFVTSNSSAQASIDGYDLFYRKFATPTGFCVTQSGVTYNTGQYDGKSLFYNNYYWYRIRSEYTDPTSNSYNSITGGGLVVDSSEWIYGSGVSDFKFDAPLDVETGLRLSSSSFSASNLRCFTGPKSALKIYLKNQESNINTTTKFNNELTRRGLDLATYTSNFTGVQYILPQDYTVGSNNTSVAGLTVERILDGDTNETPQVFILNKNSSIYGQGGAGGDGGYTDINVTVDNSQKIIRPDIVDFKFSTIGSDGGDAIKIDSNVNLFEIRKHYTARIYGGGGGGGGGDSFILTKFIDQNKFANLSNLEDSINLTIEPLEDPSTGETRLMVFSDSRVVERGSKGLYEEVITRTQDVSIDITNIGGRHQGGVGGGGQGFGFSDPGLDLSTNYLNKKRGGSKSGPGISAILTNIKHSPGGNGGIFGRKGSNGKIENEENLDAIQFDTTEAADRDGKSGGAAGKAINADGNSNYSVSTLRSKLLTVSPNEIIPSDINNLVAWFTTEQNGGNVGGSDILESTGPNDAAEANDSAARWLSRNEPGTIYLDQSSAANRPTYLEGRTLFNNHETISFEQTSTGPQYMTAVGVVGSGKIEDSIDGFDIFYVIHPSKQFENASFIGENLDLYKTGFMKWSTIKDGNHISRFYSKGGKLIDNIGVDGVDRIIFEDFTCNGKKPLYQSSCWVYNVSAKKLGNILNYNIYNNGIKIKEENIRRNAFSFISQPLIGVSRVNESGLSDIGFHGEISEIIIYKRSLTDRERDCLTGYLLNRYMRIYAASSIEDFTLSTKIEDTTNFAGFILFNS